MHHDGILVCFRRQSLKQALLPRVSAYSVPSAWTPGHQLLVLSPVQSSSSFKALSVPKPPGLVPLPACQTVDWTKSADHV